MNGLLKRTFVTSILIGASYFLLWAVAIIISLDYNFREFGQSYLYTCWQNVYGLMVSLLIFHVILPFINTRKNKIAWSILSGIFILVLLAAVYQLWLRLGMRIGTYPIVEQTMLSSGYVVRGIIYLLYGIAYFTTIKLLIHIVRLKDRNNRLQLEKKNAELSYLKSQTNPHFLFNTLNNLYSLAEERSPLTAGAILRLSEILRFMLYESEASLISIGKEMKIIREYIELERMRYDDSLSISITEDVDDAGQLVPPLLLIPLVENAFKHGVSETIHQPFIRIDLKVKRHQLVFTVENSKSKREHAGQMRVNIGLGNLRRQLDLLFADSSLEIKNEATGFRVCLSIELDSYGKV